MAEQAEGLAIALAREVGDQVRPAGLRLEQGDLEAGVAQMLGERDLDAILVAGRVDRVMCDQLREQVDGLGAELAGRDRSLLGHWLRLLSAR